MIINNSCLYVLHTPHKQTKQTFLPSFSGRKQAQAKMWEVTQATGCLKRLFDCSLRSNIYTLYTVFCHTLISCTPNTSFPGEGRYQPDRSTSNRAFWSYSRLHQTMAALEQKIKVLLQTGPTTCKGSG